MKPRKEGTLEQLEFDVGDDWPPQLPDGSIASLDDFVSKAKALAKEMGHAPRNALRRQRAESLARDLRNLAKWRHRGVSEAALYDAIGAALTFANLRHEKVDDSALSGKFKRGVYMKLKAQGLSEKAIAAKMHMTPSKLSTQRRRHGFR